MTSKREFLTCRRILEAMIIVCFILNYALRINISIAIVAMISKNYTIASSQFNWTEEQKNEILGCFFLGYVVAGIGGRLSEVYGTKLVLGLSKLVASAATLLTPAAAHWGYYWIVALRVVIGLALGIAWPAFPPLIVQWVPPEGTSKFMSHSSASMLGAAVTLPICGYLIVRFGWESVFYATGSTALVWVIAWFYLVYDSPKQHPRMSTQEREILQEQVPAKKSLIKKKVPWSKVLKSQAAWAFFVANTCVIFDAAFVITQLSPYMDQVLKYNVKDNGLLSSIPFFGAYLAALFSANLADKWRRYNRFSATFVRKFFTAVALFSCVVLFLVQSFLGYNRTVSLVVFIASSCCISLSIGGVFSNSMDLSPDFSGTLFGVTVAVSSVFSYLAMNLLGILTKDHQTFEQWRCLFGIIVVVNFFSCIIYLIFGSGEEQDWNPDDYEEETLFCSHENYSQI